MSRYRTARIKKYVVLSAVTRGVDAQGYKLSGREIDVQFQKTGITNHGGVIAAGQFGQVGSGTCDQCGVGYLEVGGGWRDYARAVNKSDFGRDVENVLIPTCKKECAVLLDRSAHGGTELVLTLFRFSIGEGILSVEDSVAQVVKRSAMPLIVAGLCHDIHNCAAGSPKVGPVGVGGNPELLYDLVAELIRSTVTATGLRKERVIVVASIHQHRGLIPANTSKSEIAV